MTLLLKAQEISKYFSFPTPCELFKDISFELYSEQSIAIMGSSGVGKSTLLHILGTLEAPTKGLLTIVGKPAEKRYLSTIRSRHIGFIFQTFNLLEEHTVINNVLMPALIAGYDVNNGSYLYKRALDLLEKVHLKERAHYLAKYLSGGEKQRAAIARALINDPEILLADEPTGNLDQENAKNIHNLLKMCVTDLGKALIVVTHDSSLAQICDFRFNLTNKTLFSLNN